MTKEDDEWWINDSTKKILVPILVKFFCGRKILCGDKTHFYLNGYVNNQNCRIRDSNSPKVFKSISLQYPITSVRCGFTTEIFIVPYSYETITPKGPVMCSVTDKNSRHMVNNLIIMSFKEREWLDKTIFKQHGALLHISLQVQESLRQKFTLEKKSLIAVFVMYVHMV